MHPVIQTIHDRGIPTGSYLRAVRYLMEKPELEQKQYQNLIDELMESGNVQCHTTITDSRQAKYTYLYLIQETLRRSDTTDKLDMDDLYTTAYIRAENYIKENPWVWAEPEDAPQKVDAQGNPKRKKGAKQEEAARIYNEHKADGKTKIIEQFMSELDMSKAGATTYFYNMRKKFGE